MEAILMRAAPISAHAEREIDTLRLILMGQLGTEAQRAAIIRIVKQWMPQGRRANVRSKLMEKLGSINSENDRLACNATGDHYAALQNVGVGSYSAGGYQELFPNQS